MTETRTCFASRVLVSQFSNNIRPIGFHEQKRLLTVSNAQQQAQEVQLLLPFDAHNHIQLSPTPMSTVEWKTIIQQSLYGMAIMATHPRDFDKVLDLAMSTRHTNVESLSSSAYHHLHLDPHFVLSLVWESILGFCTN